MTLFSVQIICTSDDPNDDLMVPITREGCQRVRVGYPRRSSRIDRVRAHVSERESTVPMRSQRVAEAVHNRF